VTEPCHLLVVLLHLYMALLTDFAFSMQCSRAYTIVPALTWAPGSSVVFALAAIQVVGCAKA
jgi:hypothetical protein